MYENEVWEIHGWRNENQREDWNYTVNKLYLANSKKLKMQEQMQKQTQKQTQK